MCGRREEENKTKQEKSQGINALSSKRSQTDYREKKVRDGKGNARR
jgi:hypothetical protein